MAAERRVAICVATCGRPAGLARLLGSIERLEIPADVALRIVVVDNDTAGSAREVCEDAVRRALPVDYVVEKRRGIPFARNTALTAALPACDFVAFIDDDEVAEPRWLAELLRVQAEHAADVVTGPCLPEYEGDPPRWVLDGGFHERPRHPTGAQRPVAYTHNALVRAGVFDALDWHFDESMGRNGGDDSELFGRVADAGFRIVWADDAVAREAVPRSRTTLRWIAMRGFRVGTSSAWIGVRRGGSRAGIVAHGVRCIAKGVALALALPAAGRARAAEGVRLVGYGLGRIAGAAGHLHPEYRTVHGA